MNVYGVYKIMEFPSGFEQLSDPLMFHHCIGTLQDATNTYYADAAHFVTRFRRQSIIPPGSLVSNREEGSDGGGQPVYTRAEIREIKLPGLL